MKNLRQRSKAQLAILFQQQQEEWSYRRHLKRKQIIEKGILTIEKSEIGIYLKIKGWCVAVVSRHSNDLPRLIRLICDTIDIMKDGTL